MWTWMATDMLVWSEQSRWKLERLSRNKMKTDRGMIDIWKFVSSLSSFLTLSLHSSAKTRDRGILFTAFHSWHSELASMMFKDLCVLFQICIIFQISQIYDFVADVTVGAFMADGVVLLRWVTGSFYTTLHCCFLSLGLFLMSSLSHTMFLYRFVWSQDPACHYSGCLHLPARLNQHLGATVPRGPPKCKLLQRHSLHAFPRKTAAWADRWGQILTRQASQRLSVLFERVTKWPVTQLLSPTET